jgi:hypothetical protein
MLKRIRSQFIDPSIEKANESGYMPSAQEIANPDKSWK